MQSFFLNSNDRPRLVNIYHLWRQEFKYTWINWSVYGSIAILLLTSFFENKLYPSLIDYTIKYKSLTAMLLVMILVINRILYTYRNKFSAKVINPITSILLCAIYCIWMTYLTSKIFYCLRHGTDQELISMMQVNFLAVFVGTVCLSRFWKEQYIFNIYTVASLCLLLAFTKLEFNQIFNLLNCQFTVFTYTFFTRREFVGKLYDQYNSLTSLVPPNIALQIVKTPDQKSLDQIFKAKNLNAICLISDWREYQKLSRTKSPEFISNLFKEYYDLVYRSLRLNCPSGNYYINWTADELFIVFYSLDDTDESLFREALSFCQSLTSQIYQEIPKICGIQLSFDVGMAAGTGLIGLLGPTSMKKTTIVGELPGLAKRLETEAKGIRISKCLKYPAVVIDKQIANFLKNKWVSFDKNFSPFQSENSDLKDQKLWWGMFPENGIPVDNTIEQPIKLVS